MAFRHQEEAPTKAIPGEILLVVHDFEARSPDELSLAKGDKIELIERDDDFGDGWYLGKHLGDGRTGLFPEVYTTAPRPTYSSTPKIAHDTEIPSSTPAVPSQPSLVASTDDDARNTISAVNQETTTPQSPLVSTSAMNPAHPAPAPLIMTQAMQRAVSVPLPTFPAQTVTSPITAQRSISMVMGSSQSHGEDSPVMNETLSVIDEHITDMNTPRSSLLTAPDHRPLNDSGSEYSNHIDHRLSYINGNETDEEERIAHSEAEVMRWSSTQVAQYLKEIGVESRHCEVFREQEISGEVLLGLDQASIFLKEFELGPVGRRLRTWHKIKSFQEEVRAYKEIYEQNAGFFSGDASSDDLEQGGSQPSTNGSMLPHIPSLLDRSGPKIKQYSMRHGIPRTLSQPQPQTQSPPPRKDSNSLSPTSISKSPDSPGRPSAASVRDFNHSRRHSSVDFAQRSAGSNAADRKELLPSGPSIAAHQKKPSFDRNWTMSSANSAVTGRTTAVLGLAGLGVSGHTFSLTTDRNTFDPNLQDNTIITNNFRDVDRGYVSGGEMENKKARKLVRKRDSASASHSRQSSYREEQSGNNLTVTKRHSRFGSADSIRDTLASVTSPASKIYHASSLKGRFRSSSTKESESTSTKEGNVSSASPKELSSPIVTKLEYADSPTASTTASPQPSRMDSPTLKEDFSLKSPSLGHTSAKARIGLRTSSGAIAENEKTLVTSPASIPSPIKEATQSPSRSESTLTTSGASKSLELESTGASSVTMGMTPKTVAKGARNKKKTSAYTRGLEKKTPQEQMKECDYSGWMKKKSPSLMTTWKPRLFVLRGRRLSYYYTENDTEEKGLIDISSHRVLPADNDRITGLHATVTGAKSSPTSPANAQTPTLNAMEVAEQTQPNALKAVANNMFIFKLVPPRTGLSRAVNFTKPTIHYFAVDNVQQGRLWMAALMKATIDRDETSPITSTYQQKTISLSKAQAMRQRPPALMGVDEKRGITDDGDSKDDISNDDEAGLNIQGLNLSYEYIVAEADKETTNSEPVREAPVINVPVTGDATEKVSGEMEIGGPGSVSKPDASTGEKSVKTDEALTSAASIGHITVESKAGDGKRERTLSGASKKSDLQRNRTMSGASTKKGIEIQFPATSMMM